MAIDLTRSKGENFTIAELSEMATSGVLRVPEFQRSFRWNSSDVLALFDSILKGYPVGSVLLWRKAAPSARVTLGSLIIDAEETGNALWVVDGQQRITSLVNAVNSEVFADDDRFRVLYLVDEQVFARMNEARGKLAIPLPDLFDVARLLEWLQSNPDAISHARDLQSITARLRDFRLPASVVEQADEAVLRDIFDRINSAGKRLRSAEIFDAIHRANGEVSSEHLSTGAMADRIAASTTFGRLDDATAYQAILIRRHPDITRDSHGEFDPERRVASDFPGEGTEESYRNAERALLITVRFLSETAGVPHVSFLPYRFLILVLTRFFALYPSPKPRNIELLRRWFWNAALRAPDLGLSGSTTVVRSLAGNIVTNDEDQSIRNLVSSTRSSQAMKIPDVKNFRTNFAASKIVLCALWWIGPRNPRSGVALERGEIAVALEGRDTPSEVAVEVVRRSKLHPDLRNSAGNRVIAVIDDLAEFRLILTSREKNSNERSYALESLLLTETSLELLASGDMNGFVRNRELEMQKALWNFLQVQTGAGLEDTPPLSNFDLDED